MNKQIPFEFIFQLFSLVIAIIIVHAIYVSVIRPNATAVLEEQAIQINANPDYVPERSAYVVVRDFEQEACFILALWAFSLMGLTRRQRFSSCLFLPLLSKLFHHRCLWSPMKFLVK